MNKNKLYEYVNNIIYHIDCIDDEGFSNYKIKQEVKRLSDIALKDLGIEDEFSYVVSEVDEEKNPIDILDWFETQEAAIIYAKAHPNTAVFLETFRKENDICEYELVWHFHDECANHITTKENLKDEAPPPKDIGERGICPRCHSEEVDYGTVEFSMGDQMFYPVTCTACGVTYEEWYMLEFSGCENITEKEEE